METSSFFASFSERRPTFRPIRIERSENGARNKRKNHPIKKRRRNYWQFAKAFNLSKSTGQGVLVADENKHLCPNCGRKVKQCSGYHRLKIYCCRYKYHHDHQKTVSYFCKECGKEFAG